MKKYLDYYKDIKSIPTVDLKDLRKKELFKQRFNFYFRLGITDKDLENKSVLELCPGTGYNSYYLIKNCKIKSIKLVEKNPFSLRKLRKNIKVFKNARIIDENIFNFNTKEKFDYVILENTIGGFTLKEAKLTFKKLEKFTHQSGVIILTFPNLYGLLSSKLRYLYSIMLLESKKIKGFKNKLSFLIKVFNSHLKCLSKNTRKTKYWILDMIFFENYIRKTNYFDINQINKLLGKNLLIKSFMPQSFTNYTWYKNMDKKIHNTNLLSQIKDNQINFLDYQTKFKIKKNLNINLKKIYSLISKLSFEKKIDRKILKKIKFEIFILKKSLDKIENKNKISLALNELTLIINNFLNNKLLSKKTYNFQRFWGIGSNVISLYKIK